MTFKREERYYVLKISDMRKYLSREKFELVGAIAEKLNAGRAVDGKSLLQAVVVEHDWPEYERVWQMIETRVVTTRRNFLNCNNDRRFWPIGRPSAEIVSPAVMKALSDFHLPVTQTQEETEQNPAAYRVVTRTKYLGREVIRAHHWVDGVPTPHAKAIVAERNELSIELAYATPPQRKPLTDEVLDLILQCSPIQAKYGDLVALSRAIEAAHGIKE
jgi:hypothetical protein